MSSYFTMRDGIDTMYKSLGIPMSTYCTMRDDIDTMYKSLGIPMRVYCTCEMASIKCIRVEVFL